MIITAQELKVKLHQVNLVVLNASQNLASSNEADLQIPGSIKFDIKHQFSNQASAFPNTFPSSEQFEENCQKLGINQDSEIVVYDNRGIYFSPRVYWMFKTMGHQNVKVLDGGLPGWGKSGYDIEDYQERNRSKGNFKANLDQQGIRYFEDIKLNCETRKAVIIDARSPERFNGLVEEPRKGLRSGQIPNSLNVHYSEVLENDYFKSKQELTTLFKAFKLGEKPLVFSCGSGITACIVLMAAEMVLDNPMAIYDGSWTEWGSLFQDV
jgi:thiosulfate/3-mercaptopyruvate sulfurtransferase